MHAPAYRRINRLETAWLKLRTGGVAKIASYTEIDGWLTRNEALGLYDIARRLPPAATVVEIGSWKGKSTFCIARGLRSGRIHAIDPFDATGDPESAALYSNVKGAAPLLEQFKHNLATRGVAHQVEPHPGYSRDFVGQFPVIDFLFIDGDHSREGCQFDFVNFSPQLRAGGYLAFHDYDASRPELGPTWVVHQEVGRDRRYQFFQLYDSLWVARKLA